MDPNLNLLIPLPLAELLFVCLGPLSKVMEDEDHRWTPLVRMVLEAYQNGRDDMLYKMYGSGVVEDIDAITIQVSEELCRWVEGLAEEEHDFQKWSEELNGE